MSLQPRDARSLDYGKTFDEGVVRTRLNELTQRFISKLAHDDMEKMADKARRAFKPVPMFQLPKDKNIKEVYGEKARKLAEEIIEQERQNYVDARAERDKTMIVEIARKLRCMVLTVDDEGKATKLKLIVDKVPTDRGEHSFRDIQYVGDHDFERLHQINLLKGRLMQLSSFCPYYSEEIKKLYAEAIDLVTLEYEYKETEKSKPQSVENPAKIIKTKKPVKTKKKAKT